MAAVPFGMSGDFACARLSRKQPTLPHMKQGFTLLELLVVISIIVALCGIAYPIYTKIQRDTQIKSTKNLVYAAAAACSLYGHEFLTGSDGRLYHTWMIGQTPTISDMDGDPRLYQVGDPSPLVSLAPPSYTGFINMTGFPPPWRPNAKGQLIDRWQQPLQIAYDTKSFTKDGIGIWSNGPNKVPLTLAQAEAPGSSAITSWMGNGDN